MHSPSLTPQTTTQHHHKTRAVGAATLTDRDRKILALAQSKMNHSSARFADAIAALHAAIDQVIPTGRIYRLGHYGLGPVFGSLITGVGLAETRDGIVVVRALPDKDIVVLGKFFK